MKIWAHVFKTLDLYFSNNASVYNLQFKLHNLWDINPVLYCHVSGLIVDITLFFVVDSRVRFTLSRPMPNVFDSRSELRPQWCLSMYITYPLILLLTFTLRISLPNVKYWVRPMDMFFISQSNLWSPDLSLHWMVGSAHVMRLLMRLMCLRKLELFLYSSSSGEISNKILDESQSNSSDSKIHWYSCISFSVVGWAMIPQVDSPT